MPVARDQMRRINHGGSPASGEAPRGIWHLATNELQAAVEAANYFDLFGEELQVGDIIMASIDIDGTVVFRNYVVSAISAAFAVTVIDQATV